MISTVCFFVTIILSLFYCFNFFVNICILFVTYLATCFLCASFGVVFTFIHRFISLYIFYLYIICFSSSHLFCYSSLRFRSIAYDLPIATGARSICLRPYVQRMGFSLKFIYGPFRGPVLFFFSYVPPFDCTAL